MFQWFFSVVRCCHFLLILIPSSTLSPVKTNATCWQNIAQPFWVKVVGCWLRMFKRSQQVGQCCVKLIRQWGYRIDVYPEALKKKQQLRAAIVTQHSVRQRKPNDVVRTV